jgi:hypothetical protein
MTTAARKLLHCRQLFIEHSYAELLHPPSPLLQRIRKSLSLTDPNKDNETCLETISQTVPRKTRENHPATNKTNNPSTKHHISDKFHPNSATPTLEHNVYMD